MKNKKLLQINKNPYMHTYSYLSQLFTIIPYDAIESDEIAVLTNLQWKISENWTDSYQSRVSNVVIDKKASTTRIKKTKINSKMIVNFYNIASGDAECTFHLAYQKFTAPYANVCLYATAPRENASSKLYDETKIDKDAFFIRSIRDGFAINLYEQQKAVSINNVKDDFWMSLKINENMISFWFSTDGITWTKQSEDVFINKKSYEVGIQVMFMEDTFSNWFFMNFIQIYLPRDLANAGMPIDYFFPHKRGNIINVSNPFIEYAEMPKKLLQTLSLNIIDYVKGNIDCNIFTNLMLNEYYVPERAATNSYDYDHENLIYGYNEEKEVFNIMGYLDGKLRYNEISYNEFYRAYQHSSNPYYTTVTSIYYNYDYFKHIFDIKPIIAGLTDYLNGTDSCKNFTQIVWNDSPRIFGVHIYDSIVNNPVNREIFLKDIRIAHFLFEHKECMLMRINYLFDNNYLNDEGYHMLIEPFQNIKDKSLLLRNLVLKFKIQQSVKTLEKIIKSLLTLRDLEMKYVPILIAFLQNDILSPEYVIESKFT